MTAQDETKRHRRLAAELAMPAGRSLNPTARSPGLFKKIDAARDSCEPPAYRLAGAASHRATPKPRVEGLRGPPPSVFIRIRPGNGPPRPIPIFPRVDCRPAFSQLGEKPGLQPR